MSDDHSALSHPTRPSRSLLRRSPLASMCSRETMRLPLEVTTSTADVPAAGTTHTCCASPGGEIAARGDEAVQHPSHGCQRASTCGVCAAARTVAISARQTTIATTAETRPGEVDEFHVVNMTRTP